MGMEGGSLYRDGVQSRQCPTHLGCVLLRGTSLSPRRHPLACNLTRGFYTPGRRALRSAHHRHHTLSAALTTLLCYTADAAAVVWSGAPIALQGVCCARAAAAAARRTHTRTPTRALPCHLRHPSARAAAATGGGGWPTAWSLLGRLAGHALGALLGQRL
jgi:hypothetical protein